MQKIKEKLNIADVIGQYVPLRRVGRNWTAKCPFHKERTPSFHVSPERGTYMCFGCGEKGDVFSFVQKMDGLDFPTALKQLAEKAGVKLDRLSPQDSTLQREKEERLHEACEAAAKFFESELKKRKDVLGYIKTRGVTLETAAVWRLGYAPADWEQLSRHLMATGFAADELVQAGLAVKSEKTPGTVFDRFRGRIMFPIFDAANQVIAFSGRFFENIPSAKGAEPAKYVNSPETELFRKSRVLYGYDRAFKAIRKADCILLVEGQFDLILAHQSGIPFAVALSGTALTGEHLARLGRLSKRLVLALDADAAGLRAGLKSALMALAAGFDVKVPVFPAGKDPADLARENPELLKAAVRTSKTAVEFFLNSLQFSARDGRGYKKIVEAQVLPLIAVMESRIDQDHFIGVVAHAIDVSPEAVRSEVINLEGLPGIAGAMPGSPEIHEKSAESLLTPLQKKAGMLIFKFGIDSKAVRRLSEALGEEKLRELERSLEPHAEELRFRFDRELGDHTSEARITEDIIVDIIRLMERERVKMKFT